MNVPEFRRAMVEAQSTFQKRVREAHEVFINSVAKAAEEQSAAIDIAESSFFDEQQTPVVGRGQEA